MFAEFEGFANLITTALDGEPEVTDPFALLQIALATGLAGAATQHGLLHYISIPADHPALTGTTSYSSGEEKWRVINEENFEGIGDAALRLGSALFSLSSAVDIRDRNSETWIDSHFGSVKSQWWFEFLHRYQPGRFEIDPRRLCRSVLALHDREAKDACEGLGPSVSLPTECINQEFHLVDVEAATAFVKRGERDVDLLWRTYDKIARRLETGGSLDDLLKPDPPEFFSGLRAREADHLASVALNRKARLAHLPTGHDRESGT
jgi:hypothetical protein